MDAPHRFRDDKAWQPADRHELLDDRVTAGGASPMKDCTTALEERLNASLARDLLKRHLATYAGNPGYNDAIRTLLAEVDDLNRRLRDATHAMQQTVGALDNEQFGTRIRVAKERLETALVELVTVYGEER